MTKEQFLKRAETIFACGLATEKSFRLLRAWLDALMRYEHTLFGQGQTQGRDWFDFLKAEFERTNEGRNTLANDSDGYDLQEMAAILCHPCQLCAESADAWHTRPGFCEHKNQ